LGTKGRALKGIIPTSRLINWKYCFTNKYFDAKLRISYPKRTKNQFNSSRLISNIPCQKKG
jgi:hypothetical protein